MRASAQYKSGRSPRSVKAVRMEPETQVGLWNRIQMGFVSSERLGEVIDGECGETGSVMRCCDMLEHGLEFGSGTRRNVLMYSA